MENDKIKFSDLHKEFIERNEEIIKNSEIWIFGLESGGEVNSSDEKDNLANYLRSGNKEKAIEILCDFNESYDSRIPVHRKSKIILETFNKLNNN